MKKPLELLLFDACVLIDFLNTEPTLIRSINASIGQVVLVTTILHDELPDLHPAKARTLGITLVEPSLETLRSTGTRVQGLSVCDDLCLQVAKQKSATCVTNDKKLRRECGEKAVKLKWGLELLGDLVERRSLSRAEALKLAKQIAQKNTHLSLDVVDRLDQRLRGKR